MESTTKDVIVSISLRKQMLRVAVKCDIVGAIYSNLQ
jgi:hypothetical protein